MRSRRGVSPINPGALHRMRQMWDLYVSPRRPIEPEGPSYAGTRAADLSSNLHCLPLTAYCLLLTAPTLLTSSETALSSAA
jgi:hypothetical protein